jgi:hypothetical protein
MSYGLSGGQGVSAFGEVERPCDKGFGGRSDLTLGGVDSLKSEFSFILFAEKGRLGIRVWEMARLALRWAMSSLFLYVCFIFCNLHFCSSIELSIFRTRLPEYRRTAST